jgi:quercetin 2,3-dioxygenase
MGKSILHRAESRGKEDYGWLQTYHTFSFGNYYSPGRMHFGALRVLNDDTVEPGMGFDSHHHDNMEIITIPLEGDLEHKDSRGNKAVIKKGDVQVMSAGTGIFHSEYNASKEKQVKLLQIWITPDTRNVTPRYGQITLNPEDSHNRLQQIVSPDPESEGVWIHQKAWFYLANLDEGEKIDYPVKAKKNGIYAFVIYGRLVLGDQKLSTRDGLGSWDTDKIKIIAEVEAEVLLMDIPMLVI